MLSALTLGRAAPAGGGAAVLRDPHFPCLSPRQLALPATPSRCCRADARQGGGSCDDTPPVAGTPTSLSQLAPLWGALRPLWRFPLLRPRAQKGWGSPCCEPLDVGPSQHLVHGPRREPVAPPPPPQGALACGSPSTSLCPDPLSQSSAGTPARRKPRSPFPTPALLPVAMTWWGAHWKRRVHWAPCAAKPAATSARPVPRRSSRAPFPLGARRCPVQRGRRAGTPPPVAEEAPGLC